MFGPEPVNDRWAPTAPPVPTTDNHHQHQHQHGYSTAHNEPTWLRFRRSMGL
ncbi:hypothetical protein Hanom_Chr14g01277221 [Helianthus anomalus]